jgi:hypothetical protein
MIACMSFTLTEVVVMVPIEVAAVPDSVVVAVLTTVDCCVAVLISVFVFVSHPPEHGHALFEPLPEPSVPLESPVSSARFKGRNRFFGGCELVLATVLATTVVVGSDVIITDVVT